MNYGNNVQWNTHLNGPFAEYAYEHTYTHTQSTERDYISDNDGVNA